MPQFNAYTAASSVAGADLVLIEQGGVTKKATGTMVSAGAVADAAAAQADADAAQTDATSALANAATADAKAVTANLDADAAQTDATTAIADAATADGKAVAAQADATTAIADAAAAQADATSGKTTAETHKSRHVHGGADQLVGDRLNVVADFLAVNFAPDASWRSGGSISELGAQLKGIDDKLASIATAKHGELYGDGIAVAVVAATTWYLVDLDTSGESSGMTLDPTTDHDITVDSLSLGIYKAHFTGSLSVVTAADELEVCIAVNGTPVAKLVCGAVPTTTGVPAPVAVSGLLDLADTDVVTVMARNVDDTNNITVHDANLSLVRI